MITEKGAAMTKETLSQLNYVKAELVMWQKELKELEANTSGSAARLSDMPHRKGASDKVGDIAARRADTIATIEKLQSELETERNDIMHFIECIDDSYIRQIMYYRHIKCYSWSLIGAEMHTTPDSVRRMHDRYLKRTEAAGAER